MLFPVRNACVHLSECMPIVKGLVPQTVPIIRQTFQTQSIDGRDPLSL